MSNRDFRRRSRWSFLFRLSAMRLKETSLRRWLAAAVLTHLAVSIIHGAAHTGAHVALSQAATLFVFVIILIGPIVGLVLTWPARRMGSWIIALTMAGSFLFGLVNHFLIAGDDHVSHVDPQWRALFTATAIILSGIELLGSGLAIAYSRER
jgi:peptidoglycan/LPS O-acetylase OafA/YrhL